MLVLNGKEVFKGVRGDALRKLVRSSDAAAAQLAAAREVHSVNAERMPVQDRFHGSTRAELFAAVRGRKAGAR